MNFCWVTLRVDNMEESLKFYHEILGMPICSRYGGNGTEIVMLGEADKPKVELLCVGNNLVTDRGEGISVGLEVESLDNAMEYIKSKQILITKGPFSPNPHTRFFFINDPNGIEVQLVENK